METTRVYVCACRRRRQKRKQTFEADEMISIDTGKDGKKREKRRIGCPSQKKLMVYTIAELGPT